MKLYAELLEAPHVLIAGTTGCGKSTLLNGIIRELMETKTPDTAKLILIDPKRIELSQYRNTEFCMAYTAESSETVTLLDQAIALTEERFTEMQQSGTREYTGSDVYIVIDELADLMISVESRVIKRKMQKILQIGRAAKVHILAATQAPSRKIIPAELVLNFTHRIALRCLASIESRQIVNVNGAEELPRHGKGLYLSPDGISTVSIPLTPDNADLIRKWKKYPKVEIIAVTTPAEKTVEHKNAPADWELPTIERLFDHLPSIFKGIAIAIGCLWVWAII